MPGDPIFNQTILMSTPQSSSTNPESQSVNQYKKVSIVVCTHNRRQLLQKTITSLLNQEYPKDDYEIIIVDNCSSDQTKDTVKQLISDSSVRIQYIYESRIGLSNARNTGLNMANGTFVGFIDDDEEVLPLWLTSLVDGFTKIQPEPGVVCGPVRPSWEKSPPHWLANEFLSYLSIFDISSEPQFISESEKWSFPEGNSAFRTDVIRDIGGFDTNAGRKGKYLLSGEGEKIKKAIYEQGMTVYYHPMMCVKHFIPADRMNLSWFCERAYFQGISNSIIEINEKSYSLLSRIKYLLLYSYWSARAFKTLVLRRCKEPRNNRRNFTSIEYVRAMLGFKYQWGRAVGLVSNISAQ